jgi:hypothetical protein
MLGKVIKVVIIEGKTTCRLHRKSPKKFDKTVMLDGRGSSPHGSGQGSDFPQNRFFGVICDYLSNNTERKGSRMPNYFQEFVARHQLF